MKQKPVWNLHACKYVKPRGKEKKANVIGILAALFYLGDESKSNGVWGLHVHMYQLACVADGLEVMWLNLAG